ncbi:MAG TPA: GFA family protein [Kofleriaceae bacterium]
MAIEGTCLCGAVSVSANRVPRTVTQCNCTTCRKYGTLWAYYQRSAIAISGKRQSYLRKRGGLRFMRCATCGAIINWESPGHSRVGINARLFDAVQIANTKISVLDGDKSWRVIESYRKPHIFISPHR